MKRCWKCKTEKSLNDFGKDSKRFDFKNPMCKLCVNAASAAWVKANAAKRKAVCAEYRANNTEKCREAYRQWFANDPVNARAVTREWAKNNKANCNAYKAKWRAKNHTKIAEIGLMRRSADGSHTGAEIENLMLKQRCKCVYCKKSLKREFHKDHIVPLKNGGSNSIDNIQLLCPTCNLSKGAKDPIDYAQQEGLLL